MSSPAEYYKSLPPITRGYGTLCFFATLGYELGVINPVWLLLDYDLVIRRFQIWRLVTNFFFLGPFSMHFGIQLLMIARYGVQLERSPFERRTADFLWMMISTMITSLILTFLISPLRDNFLGTSLVFMLVYVWSREFPNSQVSIMGLFQLQGFYLPWVLLAVNKIFGASILPDLLGIVIGHIHYFLTVLHPMGGGRQLLKTPQWVHNLVRKYRLGLPPITSSSSVAPPPAARGTTFTGRSYRLNQD